MHVHLEASGRPGEADPTLLLFRRSRFCGRIISTMSLKSAAFFALIGMILLTVLLTVGFIRDVSALLAGAIAAVVLLTSLIHLLASLSLAVFLYVFHKGQG